MTKHDAERLRARLGLIGLRVKVERQGQLYAVQADSRALDGLLFILMMMKAEGLLR